VVGIWLATRQAKREKVPANTILDLSLVALIGGIIGARILFVLLNLGYYSKHLFEIIIFWQGGLVYYGGIILSVFCGILFLKVRRLNIWKVVDICAPSLAIGQAIGRIGCFLNGCCFGKPISWGLKFPGHSLPGHPTQLYSSLNALIIFFILIMVRRKKKFNGELFWLYLLLYAVTRFGIEFLRGDDRGPIFFNLFSISQLIGIGIFILALLMFFILRRKEVRIE
ncbi:prolipoprotein diacylglyceryl transferase, partial [bacterium]|nr:prolipoprotein diacylglyceryl transferase [bacterium]